MKPKIALSCVILAPLFLILTLELNAASTQPATAPAVVGAADDQPPATAEWTGGGKPAWVDLNPKLTETQIRKMSTEDLVKALFDSEVPLRRYGASNTFGPNTTDKVIGTLEKYYPGYADLYGRQDCWRGFAGAVDFYAGQLDPKHPDISKHAMSLLGTLPKFYHCAKLHDQVTAHAPEMMAEEVQALVKIKDYLDAQAKPDAKPERGDAADFALATGMNLIDSALKFEDGISPEQYEKISSEDGTARAAFFPYHAPRVQDVRNYLAQAIRELREALPVVAPATLPAQPGGQHQFVEIIR